MAVALVLIFKATTLINFAQGELAMFGTFIAYVVAVTVGEGFKIVPVPGVAVLAIIVAMIISAAAGAAIERVLIRPFDPSDHLPVVLITLGLFLILNAIAGYIWNYQPRAFPSLFPRAGRLHRDRRRPTLLRRHRHLGRSRRDGGRPVLDPDRTKVGLAFRAVSSNTESARLLASGSVGS